MPDVTTPEAEKELEKPVDQNPEVPEQDVQDAEVEEAAEEVVEEEVGPSAEELLERLEQLEQENERLKAPKQQPTNGADPDQYVRAFNNILPDLKKKFSNATDMEAQFDVVFDMTDKAMGTVLHSKINPILSNLTMDNISLRNQIELGDLRFADDGTVNAEAVKLLPKLRERLENMSWADRAKPNAVKDLYKQLALTQARPKTVLKKPVPTGVLKDISAGGGKPAATKTRVSLTPEQKSELDSINQEQDEKMSPEVYIAKVRARQQRMKQNGKTEVVNTLR
jgi:hypothetical protein